MTRWVWITATLMLVLFTIGTSLTQVQPGERAVVRRFGRLLPEQPGPGLYIGWPWGMERVDRVPVGSVRRVVVGFRDDRSDDMPTPPGQLLTGDHNLVNVQAEIDYIVREDEVDRFALMSDRVDSLVARSIDSALAEWIAGRTVDEALLRGKAILPRVLVDDVNRRLEPYRLGVRVEQASLTRLNPPDEVRDAFERVAQAQTGIRTQINQAEQEADRKRREAESERFRLLSLAKSYSREQTLSASAEALAFLRRLEQYKEISRGQPDYLNVLWQDEITRLFAALKANGQIDLLDHHLGSGGLNVTQFPVRKK